MWLTRQASSSWSYFNEEDLPHFNPPPLLRGPLVMTPPALPATTAVLLEFTWTPFAFYQVLSESTRLKQRDSSFQRRAWSLLEKCQPLVYEGAYQCTGCEHNGWLAPGSVCELSSCLLLSATLCVGLHFIPKVEALPHLARQHLGVIWGFVLSLGYFCT